MTSGIELIAQERTEQIEKHGRTVEKDVLKNTNFELARAAEALCFHEKVNPDTIVKHFIPIDTWSESACTKMAEKPYKERLIIAGALIAAEIDRLNYTNKTDGTSDAG